MKGDVVMPRIVKSESNVVPIPMNVSVNKKGYVYSNRTTEWVPKMNGQGKRADHKKEAIGIVLCPGADWTIDRRMYANQNYYRLFSKENQQNSGTKATVYDEFPQRYDCISIGLYAAIKKLAEESGLIDMLVDVFKSEDTCTLLDLAMYMIGAGTAVFQHFPHWAASHALFSDTIRSDSYISQFSQTNVTLSKIEQFKKRWARKVLDDGRVYVCYDSTNVNSQADGVFIVQKGHAKDDPDKNQVNTEYCIRQRDGLPVTFKDYPGSINDITEATEIILFFKKLLEEKDNQEEASEETALQPGKDEEQEPLQIIMIADRGYISESNLRALRDAGIGYIMLLKKNMDITDIILEEHLDDVKKMPNYMKETGQFAYTVHRPLFPDDQKDSWFTILWDPALEVKHRYAFELEIETKEKHLASALKRHTMMTEEEMRPYTGYFNLKFHEAGKLDVNQRGRGAGKTKQVSAYELDDYQRNVDTIENEQRKCGYIIYVSAMQSSSQEIIEAVSKRDCVEKVFQALKSSMGMDKYGVHSEDSMHAKSLIWFIASIIHSMIFTSTEKARAKDKKRSTVSAIVNQLEEIRADKDLDTGKYERRYKPTKVQNTFMRLLGVTLDDIDMAIEKLQ